MTDNSTPDDTQHTFGDGERLATLIDSADGRAHDHDEAHDNLHGPSDVQFIGIFVALALVTSVEVAVSYADIGALFLPVLLFLMVAKFFGVVWYFMHVRFDHQLFGRLFYIGLGLATGVYVIMLATFQFFGA